MRDTYRSAKQSNRRKWRGFTIVELLIVVVIIAILAAITVVAYNGITANANEAALKADLKTSASRLNTDSITDGGGFPGIKPQFLGGHLGYAAGGDSFCVFGDVNSKVFHVNENGNISEGNCPARSMQTFTSKSCSYISTFTGINPESIVTLVDNRGGSVQAYEIAKLTDGKCWMLTNLKLGSTSSDITLMPSDSDVSQAFTLPTVKYSGSSDYDAPAVYGPIGGSSLGYGYLYNWPAATAGASRLTNPAGSGNATSSICPANWRLPTGGNDGDYSQLNTSFGGTNGYASLSPAADKWQNGGPFKGALSGNYYMGYGQQGAYGRLWSSSASDSNLQFSHEHTFGANGVVSPAASVNRNLGIAVRCLVR